MTRLLIVNADDFGRTRGINAGVLRAHRDGIVTSATAMVLEPAASAGIGEALATCPTLDLGLHVVLTGGGLASSPAGSLPTLAPAGRFVRDAAALPDLVDPEEVRREMEAQVAVFERLAGRPPTHLDSHHHAALHAGVGSVFEAVAARLGVPARASSPSARESLRRRGVRTPDRFLDGFYGVGATRENLRALLEGISEGTTEMMCHPGRADAELVATSTYAVERERELEILCDPSVRIDLARLGIELVGFSRLLL